MRISNILPGSLFLLLFACTSSPVGVDDGNATPEATAECAELSACCTTLAGSNAVSCEQVVALNVGDACLTSLTNFTAESSCGSTDVVVDPDAWTPPASCTVPTSGFGASVGRPLRDFTLEQCDGTPYTFYNDEYCDTEYTVISIAAEWCGPCQRESALLEEHINEVYGPRGIRVIQIIVQDINFGPPTRDLCDRWVAAYGLSNIEVIDPAGATQIYFPDNSLPSTIIVDSEGIIRYRENGVSDELITLRTKLDELLAGE